MIWIPSLSLLRTQANMPGLFSTTEPLRLLVFLFLFFPSLPRTPSSASFRFCVNVATLEASHSAPSPFLGALGPFAMLSPAIIVSLRSVAYPPCPLTRLSAPRSAEAVAMVSLLHPVPNAALGEESARVMFAEWTKSSLTMFIFAVFLNFLFFPLIFPSLNLSRQLHPCPWNPAVLVKPNRVCPSDARQSQTLNTEFCSGEIRAISWQDAKPEERGSYRLKPELPDSSSSRVFKGKDWGLGVMGEADLLVLERASVVFLSLINLIPDIIMFGAFITTVGWSTWVEEIGFCKTSHDRASAMSSLKQKAETKHDLRYCLSFHCFMFN